MQHIKRLFLLTIIITLVNACGGGGGNDTSSDTNAPSISISFPTQQFITDGDNVTVYGTATDDNTVVSVKVNGIEASTTDNYANWSVVVPLSLGENAISVSASDNLNNEYNKPNQIRVRQVMFF